MQAMKIITAISKLFIIKFFLLNRLCQPVVETVPEQSELPASSIVHNYLSRLLIFK